MLNVFKGRNRTPNITHFKSVLGDESFNNDIARENMNIDVIFLFDILKYYSIKYGKNIEVLNEPKKWYKMLDDITMRDFYFKTSNRKLIENINIYRNSKDIEVLESNMGSIICNIELFSLLILHSVYNYKILRDAPDIFTILEHNIDLKGSYERQDYYFNVPSYFSMIRSLEYMNKENFNNYFIFFKYNFRTYSSDDIFIKKYSLSDYALFSTEDKKYSDLFLEKYCKENDLNYLSAFKDLDMFELDRDMSRLDITPKITDSYITKGLIQLKYMELENYDEEKDFNKKEIVKKQVEKYLKDNIYIQTNELNKLINYIEADLELEPEFNKRVSSKKYNPNNIYLNKDIIDSVRNSIDSIFPIASIVPIETINNTILNYIEKEENIKELNEEVIVKNLDLESKESLSVFIVYLIENIFRDINNLPVSRRKFFSSFVFPNLFLNYENYINFNSEDLKELSKRFLFRLNNKENTYYSTTYVTNKREKILKENNADKLSLDLFLEYIYYFHMKKFNDKLENKTPEYFSTFMEYMELDLNEILEEIEISYEIDYVDIYFIKELFLLMNLDEFKNIILQKIKDLENKEFITYYEFSAISRIENTDEIKELKEYLYSFTLQSLYEREGFERHFFFL